MISADRTQNTSLRRRLMAGLAIVVSLFWLTATVFSSLVIRHEINEVFDSALQEVVQRVLPLAYSDILAREADDTPEQRVPDVSRHDEYITYVVRNAQGKVLLQSHDAEAARFPLDLKTGFEDRQEGRFYTESAVSGTVIVSAAEKRDHRASALRKSVMALLLPFLLLLPLIMAATLWLVRRSFQPVSDLTMAIASRGDRNLAPVPEAALPEEIRPVGAAVNHLLERLRRALEAERSFVANSAHELRTPVAGALAHTQRLIAELGPEKTSGRLADIESGLQRLARLTEKLLQLAKAEGGALRAEAPQDVRAIIPIVLRDMADAGRITTSVPDQPVMTFIDIDVFAIALRNLVENALKYGAADRPVEVILRSDGTLSVVNRGPVLAPDQFMQLCQRFQRGTHGKDGAGIGLAIVNAIAQGAGGKLTMMSPAPGKPDGVAISLALPLT